ncbi:MAG TPA: right-handed parallel beta-helix repeat-containing protein [Prolixibacteraceae bacterium]|nr:right-handed parallel beta-helix repeat-containing protein [Prolixibacteraceae bacterium]
MLKVKLLILLVVITSFVSAKEYNVSVNGNNKNDGSASKPFQTINFAAQLAQPGDVITVHSGAYREWINPARGGESDSKRIVYRAATGEKVEIKGSEVLSGWKKEKDGVWKVTVPNSFFGGYNSCKDLVFGDWCDNFGKNHTADVFLNGRSLYEMEKMEKVLIPVPYANCKDQEGSTYTWYCESDDKNTSIWANFHKSDPNKELVEISTRRTCFYPDKPGINYLTIQGFHVSQAATQWAAPTAEQIGMISTHWNKGWIIENNIISNSKCSGITLGKERSTGHNVWSANPSLDGSIHYIEVVFRTLRNGWSKENIGSHIIRNNEIFNCEQTGICGSMGAAFSIVENNHIYNIHQKNQFGGAEIGGIKFHAAIDAIIEKNRIHDNLGFGCWFDWMTQGTRITKNLFYNNAWNDLFFEVNHGPFLVDNNILLSPIAIGTQSEGGAFVHNLIAGQICTWPGSNRFTPYHLPHSTEVAGLCTIVSGDDRYYNNVFLGMGTEANTMDHYNYGLVGYNDAKLLVYKAGNVYYDRALPSKDEKNFIQNSNFKPEFKVVEVGNNVFLTYSSDLKGVYLKTSLITTELLGKAKMANEAYENPDGTPLKIDTDYFGKKRSESNPSAGPFENPGKGLIKLKVW